MRFPSDEPGRNRKLSQPWHGPYRVLQTTDTTLTVEKVYRTKQQLRVHQSRVKFCPPDLPPGYYWYGRRHHSQGKVPQWVESLTSSTGSTDDQELPPHSSSESTGSADKQELPLHSSSQSTGSADNPPPPPPPSPRMMYSWLR